MADAGANRRGIAALTAAMAAFAVNDALIKAAGQQLPVGQILFLRGVITLCVFTLALAAMRQLGTLPLAASPRVAARALVEALASACFVTALVHMQMADLVAILLSAPLMMTAMAVVFLREQVGWRRWSAVILGLIGAFFVVKPTPGTLDIWALLGVAAALFSAMRDLMTARINLAVPAVTVSFAGALAAIGCGLAVGLNESWQLPEIVPAGLVLVASLFVAGGTYLMVHAFRGVDISIVSPFRYTLLLWGGIAGFIAFGEIPDGWSAFGAALIVASGLYTLHREAVRRHSFQVPPAPR